MEIGPENEGDGELDEELGLPVQALHDMFIDEPVDEPDDEREDVSAEESDSAADEEQDGMPFEQPQSTPNATQRPRRLPDSSPRHKCTEMDSDTGEPCNADFSRAG